MLKSYIIIAWRNVLRSKAYSFINIFGLALGITCCLLLVLYIQDEVMFDKHHQRLEDIYRVTTRFGGDSGFGWTEINSVSPPIAPALAQNIPEIEAAARLVNVDQSLFTYENQRFYEYQGVVADSMVFDVLTYEFIEGNPNIALKEANSVVITDKLAKKLFGSEPALNKLIGINQETDPVQFKVTGVVKDQTKTFHHINFFTSMNSEGAAADLRSEELMGEWAGENFFEAVVKLSPHHNKKAVEAKMDAVLQKYGAQDMKALGMTKTLALEPIKDIHLYSAIGTSPRVTYIYVIASIAAFILLIACINFMNLSTARATKRAAEIGIRKVMGAFRSSLVRHILGEAMIIVLIAIMLSIVLVQIALPDFNTLTGKNISFGTANAVYFIIALIVLTIVTGLIAGSYPAFYLSSFQPAEVLKGKFNIGNSSGWLRRTLVVFQFMIAIALVSGMIIISKQLSYMQDKNLGFNSRAKIVLPLRTSSARKQYEALRSELSKNNAVKQISAARYMPGTRIFNDMMFYKDGGDMDHAITNFRNRIDYDYIELLGIKMLAGRSFTDNREVESKNKVIVNRTSAKKFGFEPAEIIGQHLYFDWQGQKYNYEVIGVMEDFHQTSLKEEIKAIMFEIPGEATRYDYMIASVEPTDFNNTVASIEKVWKELVNDTPFEYSFLDENIQRQYDEDRKVSSIITIFTCIAVLISCLGLYGLSTYMAERRFKEMGVRKVMGASVNQIVTLMSSEFIKLIVIALIISVPLAWYAMDRWLEGFAYRTSIDVLVFVYAGGAAMLVALLTVSFESFKAATANPLKALRNE